MIQIRDVHGGAAAAATATAIAADFFRKHRGAVVYSKYDGGSDTAAGISFFYCRGAARQRLNFWKNFFSFFLKKSMMFEIIILLYF